MKLKSTLLQNRFDFVCQKEYAIYIKYILGEKNED